MKLLCWTLIIGGLGYLYGARHQPPIALACPAPTVIGPPMLWRPQTGWRPVAPATAPTPAITASADP